MFQKTRDTINAMINSKMNDIIFKHRIGIDGYGHEYKTCETCGCLVNKNVAVRGKSIIDKKLIIQQSSFSLDGKPKYEYGEFIRKVWYCKIHAPNTDN